MNYTIIPAETKHAEQVVQLRRKEGIIENILSMPTEPTLKFENLWNTYNPNTHNFVALTDDNQVV